MDDKRFNRPEHVSEEAWLQYLQKMAVMDERAHEKYAEHLTRVQPDADYSKASLQARYKALHDSEQD